uniref:Uncharacterized protein n=1 Tax=viral metagenome TaxID=1070528 RepID=A0A6C0KJE3_9ZZZZ
MKYLDIRIFIISFAVGMFFVYMTAPKLHTILVYPHPDNEEQILYKDKNDTCFKFKSVKVTCPKNKNEIKNIPIQV